MNESNIGQTIKSVVSILCVIGIIVCVIAGFALISQGLGAIGWPVMLVGAFSMAITWLFLYGFGELVDKTSANNAALLRIEMELRSFREKKGSIQQLGATDAQKSNRPMAEKSVKTPVALEVDISDTVLRDASGRDVMPFIKTMKSNKTIYGYLSQKLDAGDENVRELLKILKVCGNISSSDEDQEGNTSAALAVIQFYVEHGNRVFPVDRRKPTLTCPVCGQEQDSERNVCSSCGALFRL